MSLLAPFYPVRMEKTNNKFIVSASNRVCTFGENSMPESILVNGNELLAAPIRLAGSEQGEPMEFRTDYETNESAAFISKRSDEEVLLCGALQTKRFILNHKVRFSFDGCMDIVLSIMPAGKTVAEVFGVESGKKPAYELDSLALEIPLRREALLHYSLYPANEVLLADGTVLPKSPMSSSGKIPDQDMYFPFEALLWFGCEECGLGIYADNPKGRELNDAKRALELVRSEDGNYLLRVRLLDHHPTEWPAPYESGCYRYPPLSFRFGLQATPVKDFPKDPYIHNALHLDCFIKTPGDYLDFLSENGRFDRLKQKGVNTLILHEKWNRQQNCFDPSGYSRFQIRRIVEECHARGIRVLTYFGYEMSTLDADFEDLFPSVREEVGGRPAGGWYRVPFQRDYNVCYNSEAAERMLKGIADVMDTCHTDGVYLDGTATPIYCCNARHGCGWTDENGKAQGSYPVTAVRSLFRRLYETVRFRGGYISVHAYGCVNFTALPYIDQSWYGENLQFDYITGNFSDVPLDYFRAEYTGRNMGVPVEFIAYEKRPVWNFENALAICLPHGILPRPNDIEGPLELMSGIWSILEHFPVSQSEWCPYWKNGAQTSHEKVKASYYRYRSLSGKVSLLMFLANTSCQKASGVSFRIGEGVDRWSDITSGEPADLPGTIELEPYSCRILFAES